MTIEKGGVWGEPWPDDRRPREVPEVADDAAVARLVAEGRADSAAAEHPPTVTPLSGDLLRTIGLDRPREPSQRHRYPIDLGLATLGRRPGDQEVVAPFVAHLTVRNRPLTGLGPGLSVAVMNAAWLGPLRLGPRAHPNDGVVDVTEGTVGLLQRREATRRAVSGSHLPHPGLATRRTARWQRSWARPVGIWLDGRRVGRFRSVAVEVVPDAGIVVA